MPTARIVVDDNFRKLGSQYSNAVNKALGRAAAVTIASARSAPVDYQIGSILNSIKATPAHTTSRGKRVIVYAEDYRAIFYEFGTYARHRRKLRYTRTAKAEAIAAERGSGVKAQHFLGHAIKLGKEALHRYLAAYMR